MDYELWTMNYGLPEAIPHLKIKELRSRQLKNLKSHKLNNHQENRVLADGLT